MVEMQAFEAVIRESKFSRLLILLTNSFTIRDDLVHPFEISGRRFDTQRSVNEGRPLVDWVVNFRRRPHPADHGPLIRP